MARLKDALQLVLLCVVTLIVLGPFLPKSTFGGTASKIAAWLRQVSVVQSWRMYAPNPQRAQIYMDLTAVYDDGTEVELVETQIERAGWSTQYAWTKTRMDIWRHYANFRPKQANEHRKWYLRGVCVREARKGRIPKKVVMHHVRRKFTAPQRVREGAPPLSRPRRRFVTVEYCGNARVKAMIDADRARRGQEPVQG